MTYIRTNDSTLTDYIMVPMAIPCKRLQVSDGYHTFEELYQHCDALFARLCQEREILGHTCKVLLDDFLGHCIYKAAIRMPKGWVYRQLPVGIWDRLDVEEERVLRHPIQDVSEYNSYTIECLLGQPMPALKPNTESLPHVITLPGSHHLEIPCLVSQVSDGANTFDDLYAMRHALFVALCHEMSERGAWKSLVHEDHRRCSELREEGTSFDGYFIAGIELPQGMITYHLPMELWDILKVETLDKGRPWDGHTAADVVGRLLQGL